jgi:TonB family protein
MFVPVVCVWLSLGSADPAPSLQVNQTVERKLSAGQSDDFLVASAGMERFHLAVVQHGVDVTITVAGPDGAAMGTFDSPNGVEGPEPVDVRAMAPGAYHIAIAATAGKDGKYSVTLTELRPLTAREVDDVRAERDVADVERQWEAALNAHDAATLASIMRDDGIWIAQTVESLQTKAQHTPPPATPPPTEPLLTRTSTLSQQVIRVFGDTAFSTGRALVRFSSSRGIVDQFTGQFVHVFQKDGSGWKLIVDHFYRYGRLPASPLANVSLDAKSLAPFEGVYLLDSGSTVGVGIRQGRLIANFGNGAVELTPMSDATFQTADGQLELTFPRSANGTIDELILVSDEPAIRGHRVRSAASTSQQADTLAGAYEVGNGVSPPTARKQVQPSYTRDAMNARIEGQVVVQAVVGPDGRVSNVRIIKSLDRTYGLDEEAVKAVKKWEFNPGKRSDEPVPVQVTIVLTFTLKR